MTARQPGEGRQGTKGQPGNGDDVANDSAAVRGPAFREFWGAHDFWTEYLCMERNKEGRITLTSVLQIPAEAGRYKVGHRAEEHLREFPTACDVALRP
jgi:hypothetical protein